MDMLRAVITDLLDMGITEDQIIKVVRSVSAMKALKNYRKGEMRNELIKKCNK